MEESQKLIVVPWDFTPVADNALAHAVKISRMVSDEICLLHIVDPGIKSNVLGEKKVLLRHVADENGKKYNMQIHQNQKLSIHNGKLRLTHFRIFL